MMRTPERSEQIEELFHSALERSPRQRSVFLSETCRDDPGLRREVETLLAALEEAPGFLEEPLCGGLPSAITQDGPLPPADDGTSLVGERVGAWELVRKIAEGGMGTVYLARRADGHYEKQVAIKLIRRGIVADDAVQRERMIRRFREELQHHAILDHPNIAKLLDGGTTTDGLPYLVVEYVEGPPIFKYCEAHSLSITERLKLFRGVCLAVQHAHNRFIAHCDIKPSNILVTPGLEPPGEAAPKLLDFGIARLLNQENNGRLQAAVTTGMRPLTPQYASPEQIRCGPLTAASDVYSLGVVMYELISGELPYKVTEYDAKRIICEHAPKRPSAIRRDVDRELDTIVLKALEKDPARRYASAAGLTEDIDRFLTGRPILAHDDSALYRFSKFLNRRKSQIAVICLIAAGIAFGIWIGTLTTELERRVAEGQWSNRISKLDSVARRRHAAGMALASQGNRLEAERQFYDAQVCFQQVRDMEESPPPGGTARSEWLQSETARLMAHCLIELGQYDRAESLLLEQYPIVRAHWGDNNPRTQETRQWIITLYERWGKPAQANAYRLPGG